MQESTISPYPPAQPVASSPFGSSSKRAPRLAALVLLVLIVMAGSIWIFQKLRTASTPPNGSVTSNQPTNSELPYIVQQDGTKVAKSNAETFSDSTQGVAVPVGTCQSGTTVQINSSAVIEFTGITTLRNEPFCKMTMVVSSGSFAGAGLDCSFKLDGRQEIYLVVDETGTDGRFINQHCRVR